MKNIVTILLISILLAGSNYRVERSHSLGGKLAELTKLVTLIPEARADDGLVQVVNVVRLLFFLIVGFPDTATYNSLTGGGSNGPPQNGLVSLVSDVTKHVAEATNVSSCAELPTSGSASVPATEGTFSMKFLTPDGKIPTGYAGAGSLYERKIDISLNGSKVMSIQFDCSAPRGYAKFAFPETAGGTRTMNLAFQSPGSGITTTMADFVMYYDKINERFAMSLNGDPTVYDIKAVRAAPADSGGGFQGDRILARGNPVTKDVTMYFQDIGATTMSGLAAATNADRTVVTAGSSKEEGFLICVNQDNPSGATLGACSSLALTTPGAPLLAPSGSYTISFAAGSSYSGSVSAP